MTGCIIGPAQLPAVCMPPDLSVVIPIYNESPNVRSSTRELTATLEAWGRPYEIVAVDDGSTRRQLSTPGASCTPPIRGCA